MKLLNYSDMIFYKENGVSISGLKYVHLPYGPVPDNFEIFLERMANDRIAHIEISYENGYEFHYLVSDGEIGKGILSESEKVVLERVFSKFKDFGSAEISDYSHKEKGYIATTPGEIISYVYAKDILID